jgi:chorismate dehydratase
MHEAWRLGVVSYLNSRPLIEGLDATRGIELVYDVPARLPGLLEAGEVDAALVPVVDLARRGRDWKIVSDACIGCDGETLTVRIFARVPPEEIQRLHVDGDSHTSIALATLIWREMYGRDLIITPLDGVESFDECQAVLLIGDKVVNHRLIDFNHEIDLGGAWKSLTGLPFVFAVWAAPRRRDTNELATMLSAARDEGVRRAKVIAADAGPGMGWPVELAQRYLTMRLKFTLTERFREGLRTFLELAQRAHIVPSGAESVGSECSVSS